MRGFRLVFNDRAKLLNATVEGFEDLAILGDFRGKPDRSFFIKIAVVVGSGEVFINLP